MLTEEPILGISGKFCAGKNTLCSLLEEEGFTSLDLDRLGHEALEAKKDSLRTLFGPSIFTPSDDVNRHILGHLLFSHPSLLQQWEALAHPWIEEKVQEILMASPSKRWVLNASLLHKTPRLQHLCATIIWVEAHALTRLWRAVSKRGFSLREAILRIRVQRAFGPQHFLQNTDIYTVKNDGGRRALRRRLSILLAQVLPLWEERDSTV